VTIMKILNGIIVLYGDLRSLLRREIDFYKVNPKTSTLFLTYRCNSKCKTCSMWQRPQDVEIRNEIGLNEWKSIVGKLADAGIESTKISLSRFFDICMRKE